MDFSGPVERGGHAFDVVAHPVGWTSEFTFANVLNFVNMQVEINMLGRGNAAVSIAVSVAALLFAFALLVIISFAGGRRRRGGVAGGRT